MKKISLFGIAAILASFLLLYCGGGGGGDSSSTPPSGIPVTATFSLPKTVDGIGFICIDNDLDRDNGAMRHVEIPPGPTDSVTCTFQDVPAGTYYIYGCFNVGSTTTGPPRVGDYHAIFGWDGNAGNEPKNPNAVVPSSGTIKFFFTGFEVLPPPVNEPPVVSTSAATSISPSGATLNGSVNPSGLATIAWFEWGTNPTLTNFSTTASQQAGSGTTSQSIAQTLSGLGQGTTFYFRIAASNSAGESKGTIRNFTTTTIGAPPTASTSAATSISSTGATLNGSVNPNGLATDAWFEYGTSSSSLTSSTPTKSAGSGTTSVAISDQLTGLTCGTQYYYRIAASNSAGDAEGSIRNFTTSACPLPCVNIAGNWDMVGTVNYPPACTGGDLTGYTGVTQTDCSVDFDWGISGDWSGTVSGSTVSVSGSLFVGGVFMNYSSVILTVSPDGNSMSGPGSWNVITIPGCSGTTDFTFTR